MYNVKIYLLNYRQHSPTQLELNTCEQVLYYILY